MKSLRTSAFFTASVAAHLAVGALFVRAAPPVRAETPTSAALTGESLTLPEDLVTEEVEPPPPHAPIPTLPAPGSAATAHASNPSSAHTGSAASSEPGTYGAAGERGVNDISDTFTRAFPQAASADLVWLAVPFGNAGSAQVSLEIDGSGAFVHATIEHAVPALRRAIERSVALIRGRTFTARGRITRLYLSATVSPDDVHDGLHGDFFAIGGSFTGHRGNAFFALPGAGRRIDIVVHDGDRATPIRGGT